MMRCLYFGCWNQAGHYLHTPGGGSPTEAERRLEYYGKRPEPEHLDGTLAPRRHRYTGELCWQGQGESREQRSRIRYDSNEFEQGQFLRHKLNTGYTAISWWDRCQGDRRGACNSTILLEGEHTTEEMLAALAEHFPHVLENLKRHGVELVDVTPPTPAQLTTDGRGS